MIFNKPSLELANNLYQSIQIEGLHFLNTQIEVNSDLIEKFANDEIKFEVFVKKHLEPMRQTWRLLNMYVTCLICHTETHDFFPGLNKEDCISNLKILQMHLFEVERSLIVLLNVSYLAENLENLTDQEDLRLRNYLRLGIQQSTSRHSIENLVPCALKSLCIDELIHNHIKILSVTPLAQRVEDSTKLATLKKVIEQEDSIYSDFIDAFESVGINHDEILMVQIDQVHGSDDATLMLGYSIIDFVYGPATEHKVGGIMAMDSQVYTGLTAANLNLFFPHLDLEFRNLEPKDQSSKALESIWDLNFISTLQAFLENAFKQFKYIYFINGNELFERRNDMGDLQQDKAVFALLNDPNTAC